MDLDRFITDHVLQSMQQRYFVHFTDSANLASIRQHGLLSMRELQRRGIEIPAAGGNQWSRDADKAAGMDAYVHLCFKRGHPMEKSAVDGGNIKDLRYLPIKPQVIKLPGVMITKDVSNKSGVVPGDPAAMLDQLDLEVLYKRTNWKDPEIYKRLVAAEKCELLIPDHIPLEHIMNI
jgi:ssDNA thymidine ADP-ribosyltransferase DarT-like protein